MNVAHPDTDAKCDPQSPSPMRRNVLSVIQFICGGTPAPHQRERLPDAHVSRSHPHTRMPPPIPISSHTVCLRFQYVPMQVMPRACLSGRPPSSRCVRDRAWRTHVHACARVQSFSIAVIMLCATEISLHYPPCAMRRAGHRSPSSRSRTLRLTGRRAMTFHHCLRLLPQPWTQWHT